jgi:beta-glucosidase
MAAFNAVNKVPMHANGELIEGWLRGTVGFDGLVVSDYTGVRELVDHGIGKIPTVVVRALLAGVDMDMVGENYLHELPALAEAGLHAPECGLALSADRIRALIDRACLRVLLFKAELGLLDDPFRGLDGGRPAPGRSESHALARRAAARSAVLLKNDGVLPLAERGKIAVIGPLADDRANMLGTWAVSGQASEVRTLREAFAERRGPDLVFARGANIVDEPWLARRLNCHGVTVDADPRSAEAMIDEAVTAARAAEVAVVAIGEAKEQAGESSSVLAPVVPEPQRRLVEALAETGTPLVILVFAGRPLALGAIADRAAALVYAWHGGTAGPEGIADLLFGEAEPVGRLAATLPAAPGQVPVHHATEPTGRPHRGRFEKFRSGWLDLEDGVTGFPFGFGLGYAGVHYGAPTLSQTVLRGTEAVAELSVDLTNTGDRPATETAQLYLSDPVARITRPSRMLKDFRQIVIPPGETRTVRFTVPHRMLRYTVAPSLEAAEQVWDPGTFVLHVGPNSRDTQSVELRWEA